MTRRMIALLCALGCLISLTACGGTAPTSSDLPDVSNESDVLTPDGEYVAVRRESLDDLIRNDM